MLASLNEKNSGRVEDSYIYIPNLWMGMFTLTIVIFFSSCNKNHSNLVIKEELENYSSTDLPQAEVVAVNKIWDSADHNAFTDLIEYKGKYYCVFREGSSHLQRDGTIRVLQSENLSVWDSVQKIEMPAHDLRDPKLSISPDDQLLISAAGAFIDTTTKSFTHETYLWTSDNGVDWSKPKNISKAEHWLWQIRWNYNADTALGFAYKTGSKNTKSLSLYKANSHFDFKPLKEDIYNDGIVSESDILFLDNDVALTMARRDGDSDNSAVLGFATPPYQEWKWKPTNRRAASPSLVLLPENKIIAAVRLYDPHIRTSICLVDPVKAEITEIIELESGGDTGYPGMLYVNDTLYVSYYSSHEGKSAVYLAEVKVDLSEE